MVTVSSEFAGTSPIQESLLESEAAAAFEAGSSIQDGINAYLKSLTSRPEAQNYKFIVHATELGANAQGPVKTYTGAYWNAEQDGTWATYLAKRSLLVTVIWTKL